MQHHNITTNCVQDTKSQRMDDQNLPVRGTPTDDDDGGDDRFLGDPLLPAFYRQEQDTYFSLGLVVNWATTTTTSSLSPQQSYNATNHERFVSAVKTECFSGRNNKNSEGIPFFLPFHALHITIASLVQACKLSELPQSRRQQHTAEPTIIVNTDADVDAAGEAVPVPSKQKTTTDNTAADISDSFAAGDDDGGHQRRLALATKWKQVVRRASTSEDWPRRPLELELDAAQIRNRAGIFLWKEHTGGIAQMRRCLQVAANQHDEDDDDDELFTSTLKIPDIIHTTFVRYHQNHHQHNRDEVGTEKSPDTTTTGNDNSSDEATVLRPSQAHSILNERVVPNQALFSKATSDSDDDKDDADHHLSCGTGSANGSSNGANIKQVVVAVDAASLVDCKIYLLDPGKERDHEVFLSLPLVQD